MSILQYHVCRDNLFKSFTTINGFTVLPKPGRRASGFSASFQQSFHWLSTTPVLRSEIVQQHESEEPKMVTYKPVTSSVTSSEEHKPPFSELLQQLEEPEVMSYRPFNASLEELEGSENASLPWYLQVQGPQRTERSLSSRQKLPDLPVDPPPLLQPILEHISIKLGMDDLSLFDLRKLDPSSALGTNLVMIMGTARGEQHLHVSADRFCRWLRTEYKLTPYADGLLGRNELKLKMKRKARRAKLYNNVGSTMKSGIDDVIRTGWVCVNVGTIDGVGETPEELEQGDDFVGFGGQTGGVKLVVQLMTEQKREDLDLEGLWSGAIARQERKKLREAAKLEEESQSIGDKSDKQPNASIKE